jgi:hypothetical protein
LRFQKREKTQSKTPHVTTTCGAPTRAKDRIKSNVKSCRPKRFGKRLFWVRDDIEEVVAVSLDEKIEAPTAIHAALPNAPRLIITSWL